MGDRDVLLVLTVAFGSLLGCTWALLLCRAAVWRWRRKGVGAEFDVFISYRVKADGALVARLYEELTKRELKVFYDKKSLLPGLRWEHSFVDGLRRSLVIVPVLSKRALAPLGELTA